VSYVDELSNALADVGISRSLRRRILAEFTDHLACDPEAELGAPRALARQFADELGTARARRAGLTTFLALALAGALFGVVLLTSPGAAAFTNGAPPDSPLLGRLANLVAVLAPQLALVTGTLAGLRVLRRRSEPVIPRAEAVIIARRALLGVLAGFASMAALALMAIEFHRDVPSWWMTFALIASAVGAGALAFVTPAAFSAARTLPAAEGSAGDLFDDLGAVVPGRLRGRPWWFAVTVAAGVALAITVAGFAGSDGYDGALRGLLDALACLGGFALLGRYLGLREARERPEAREA
jgi:hypothetical protein